MSGEVARLGLAVESEQVKQGSADLNVFAASAQKAEAAAAGMKSQSTAAASGMVALSGSTTQGAAAFQRQVSGANASTASLKANAAAAQFAAKEIRSLASANDNMAKFRRQNLTYQLFDVGQTIGTMGAMRTLIQQGPQVVQLYAGQGGVRTALSDVLGIFGRMGPVVAGATAVAGGALIGLRHEINETSDVTVGFGDVIKATWQTASDGIYDLLKPSIDELSPWFGSAWDSVVDSTAFAVNDLVGHVVGGFEFIKEAGLQLPEAFGDIAYRIADKFYSGISQMVRDTLTDINGMIGRINYALADTGIQLKDMGTPGFGLDPDTHLQKHIENPYAGAADKAIGAFNDAMGRDYAGEWFGAIRDKAVELAKASKDAGKALKDAAADAVDPWAGMRDVTEGVKEQMRDLKRQSEATQRAWERFGDGATDIFSGLITHTMSWKEALASAIPMVKDLILNLMKAQSITGGGGSGLGSWLASLFGGGTTSYASDILSGVRVGLFHDGRYPGNAGSTRMADPSWFIGAPRYHDGRIPGLKPDEEPAILRRDEPVFRSMQHARQVVGAANNNQPSAGNQDGGVNVTYAPVYNVTGSGPELVQLRQEMARDRAQFKGRVVEAVADARRRHINI